MDESEFYTLTPGSAVYLSFPSDGRLNSSSRSIVANNKQGSQGSRKGFPTTASLLDDLFGHGIIYRKFGGTFFGGNGHPCTHHWVSMTIYG